MASHEIRIDRSKTLLQEPSTGHNRWHPDIPPVVRCEPGDEVVLEVRDALDGQAGPGSWPPAATFLTLNGELPQITVADRPAG
ncbi:MAG TPA: acetamidase/formamidase family protein [Streptosporangiaceae bacterium]|jgi:acetamidase/formamidase